MILEEGGDVLYRVYNNAQDVIYTVGMQIVNNL